jgi:hypothetical protein
MRYTQIHRDDMHERDDSTTAPKVSIGKAKERDGMEGLGLRLQNSTTILAL